MSVIIKNMALPKSCTDCPMFDWNEENGSCTATRRRLKAKEEPIGARRADDCPLIELPAQHGRLGDLDAMAFDESEAYMSAQAKLGRDVITTGINSIVHRKIQLLIMDTPTIIESEVNK